MRFSILVPVYQSEKYLPECIMSIKNQSYADYEVILVDDGSTDASGSICDIYKKNDSRVRVIHKNNEGLLMARRDAIKEAHGEYLIFVDSDDTMQPNELERISLAIDATYPDIVLFNAYLLHGECKRVFYSDLFAEGLYKESEIFLKKMAKDFSINGMWLKAVKSSVIDRYKNYEQIRYVSNGEDLLQSVEFYSRAKSIYYLNEALYNYRINSQSMTNNYSKNYYISFREAFKELLTALEKRKLKSSIYEAEVLFLGRVYEDMVQSCANGSPLGQKEKINHLKYIGQDDFYQKVYSDVKSQNPFWRSRILFNMLEKHLYWSAIMYVTIWKYYDAIRKKIL